MPRNGETANEYGNFNELFVRDGLELGGGMDPEKIGGTYYADPGELQAKIDEAYQQGGGKVIGEPDEVFDPDSTIEVKPNVELVVVGNGVKLTSDIDVFRMHERSELVAQVDTSGVTYTSRVVSIRTAETGPIYTMKDAPEVNLECQGTKGEGTALFLHQNGTDEAISFVDADVRIDEYDVGIDVYSQGSGGWINGNHLTGFIRGCNVMLQDRGSGTVAGNWFHDIGLQPFGSSNSQGATALGYDKQAPGGRNIFGGVHWDNTRYSTAYVRYGSSAGFHNTAVPTVAADGTQITNNSGNPQWLWEHTRPHRVHEISSGDWVEKWANPSTGNIEVRYYDASAGSKSTIYNLKDYEMEMKASLNLSGNRETFRRDVPGAAAGDLANGEVATDSTNGRLVWKDTNGNAYYVSGTAL